MGHATGRTGSRAVAQRLLAGSRRSILLFDEMEDLLSDAAPHFGFFGRSFNSRGREGNSKVFMHRLLELRA